MLVHAVVGGFTPGNTSFLVMNPDFLKCVYPQERRSPDSVKMTEIEWWVWFRLEMTHQAVADHLNVSRKTIPRLMIRLPQTGRTNDRLRNGRLGATYQRQDSYLRLRMRTAEDTARGTPGLASVQI